MGSSGCLWFGTTALTSINLLHVGAFVPEELLGDWAVEQVLLLRHLLQEVVEESFPVLDFLFVLASLG